MRSALAISVFAAALGNVAYAAPTLLPGLYEVRLRTTFADAQSEVPVNTIRRCVSATETAVPPRLAPQFSGGADCTISDLNTEGNRASWNLVCNGEPAMRGRAELSWNNADYSGDTRMTLHRGTEQMEMKQSYTARRLGEC